MNTKEILEKLKVTFSELVNGSPETAPEMVVPTKAKLKDGTEVEISELGVGGVVTIAGQPAPVGEHTLEDGTVIVVGENGVITELKPVEGAPVVEDMGKDMKEKFSAFETATNEKFSAYEAKFADYEVRLSKATKVIEGLLALTTTLAEQPTGTPDPVVTGKNNFSQTEKVEKNYSLLFS